MIVSKPSPITKQISSYIFNFNDLIGQGSFSKVYKGYHQLTKHTVAIKVIQLNSINSVKLKELLFNEIQILKKLDHPNILKCYEVFNSDHNCYIITEICNQGDLQTKLRNKGHLKEYQAQNYIADIFNGLKYLSTKNIIHRDIKVSNIFLSNGIAKIADFGFSKITQNSFQDISIGSPIYMAPQGFIQNIYGPKTDVWAFGILIYELLHGKTPYSHCQNQIELRNEIMIPLNFCQFSGQLSLELKQLIMKCLQIDERKRISVQRLSKQQYLKDLLNKKQKRQNKTSRTTQTNTIFLENNRTQRFKTIQNTNYQQYKRKFVRSFKKSNFIAIGQKVKKNQIISGSSPYNHKAESTSNNYIDVSSSQPTHQNYSQISVNATNYIQLKQGVSSDHNFAIYKTFKFDNNKKTAPFDPLTQQTKKNKRKAKIFMGFLSFKSCVNILHYCRLIYKLLVILKDKGTTDIYFNLFNPLSCWMFQIFQQLINKIESKQALHEVDRNSQKQKKVKEVYQQYYKKYRSDLMNPEICQIIDFQIVLKKTNQQLGYIQQKINKQILQSTLIDIAHFLIIINHSTYILKQCSSSSNYYNCQNYHEIQNFLSLSQSSLTYYTYLRYKHKYT